jgi:DNA polymerase I-like protein with 3'-5' exonuclease and polymerase domains
MNQANLFAPQTTTNRSRGFDRLPDQLPPGPVAFDTETTGLDLRGSSRPFCFSVATAEDAWCCEWNPQWIADNLAGRDVIMCGAKFDVWASLTTDVDLEYYDVKPHDVQHCALLLDDHRRKFSLDTLSLERLGRRKNELPSKNVWELPTHVVVPYSRQDARLTYDLWQSYQPDLKAQGLEKVQQLEDDLIYCTLAMERNGCQLDMPKLERWVDEVKQSIVERTLRLWQLTGLRVNPDTDDIRKLVRYVGVNHTGFLTKSGKSESFSSDALEPLRHKPEINLALEIRELKSWLSKCGDKYLNENINGVLYYKLHQLRCDEGGTITGRYAGDIQQVMKPDKQPKVTQPWIVRELFTAAKGLQLWDSDASQIEYRLFAHFSNVPYPHSQRLIKAYTENPDIDFHDFVTHDILKDIMIRSLAKNVSFAKLYGGGVGKISLMTGLDMVQAEETVNDYDRAFPEAARLLNYCTKLAERRGFVRTMLGRRRRYFPGDRFYSALNSILQGTAADVMKLKLLRLYRERKTTGTCPRLTNHDETLGDITESYTVARVNEILAIQELPTRVPLTWDTGVGNNWKEAML